MRRENCKHIAFRTDIKKDRTNMDEAYCMRRSMGYPDELRCDGCKEFDENPLMKQSA